MRYLAVVLMFGLALAVAWVPSVAEPAPNGGPGIEPPPMAVCPLTEVADRHTAVSVLSSINGRGRVSAFAAGSETGTLDFSTGTSGSFTVAAAELDVVGTTGGLVEMPSHSTTAGVTITGATAFGAEGCASRPAAQVVVSGGSTAGDEDLRVRLLNPYSGEANVDVVVATETGLESDQRFQGVRIPPLTTVTLDMGTIIPERERITAIVEATRGSVVAMAVQTIGGRIAVWRAVEPATDWWLPAPRGGERKELVITNPAAGEAEFQVDFYGPEGLVEAGQTGVLLPRGEVRIPLTTETIEPVAVRVISTSPVTATLWIETPEALAATTGAPVDASTWLLPGAHGPAGGTGTLVVLNSGLDPVTVTVRSLGDRSLVRDFDLPAGELLEIALVAANGYRVEATGPVVALWSALMGGDGSVAMGQALLDG